MLDGTMRADRTRFPWTLTRATLLVAALACAAFAPAHWRDPATGVAIGGFDPINYFTHGKARRGSADHEWVWRGATWRFANSGNRAAFARNPTVYAPQFAGYDVTAIAKGTTVTGHPSIWAVRKNRLYLFHDPVNRRMWQKDPDGVISRATKAWKELSRGLPIAEKD